MRTTLTSLSVLLLLASEPGQASSQNSDGLTPEQVATGYDFPALKEIQELCKYVQDKKILHTEEVAYVCGLYKGERSRLRGVMIPRGGNSTSTKIAENHTATSLSFLLNWITNDPSKLDKSHREKLAPLLSSILVEMKAKSSTPDFNTYLKKDYDEALNMVAGQG